jgi:hypothetical protein
VRRGRQILDLHCVWKQGKLKLQWDWGPGGFETGWFVTGEHRACVCRVESARDDGKGPLHRQEGPDWKRWRLSLKQEEGPASTIASCPRVCLWAWPFGNQKTGQAMFLTFMSKEVTSFWCPTRAAFSRSRPFRGHLHTLHGLQLLAFPSLSSLLLVPYCSYLCLG